MSERPEKLQSAEHLTHATVQFTNHLQLRVPEGNDPGAVLYAAAQVLEVPGAAAQFKNGDELQFWTPRTEFTTLAQPEGKGYTIDIYDPRVAASLGVRQQIEAAAHVEAVAPSLVIDLETTSAEATMQILESQEGLNITSLMDKQARHHDFTVNILPYYREQCLSARKTEDLAYAWYSARYALQRAGIMEPRQLAEMFGSISSSWLGHDGLAMSVDEKCLQLQRIAGSSDIGPAARRTFIKEFASTLDMDMQNDVPIEKMWTFSAPNDEHPFVISFVCEGQGMYNRITGQFAPRDFGQKLWLYAHAGSDMRSSNIEHRNAMIAAATAYSGNHPMVNQAILRQFGCPVATTF